MRETIYPPAIRLKIDRFRAETRDRGWITHQQIADGIGLDRANVTRPLNKDPNRRQAPGATFIAAVLTAFPEREFCDFFEVVSDQAEGKSA